MRILEIIAALIYVDVALARVEMIIQRIELSPTRPESLIDWNKLKVTKPDRNYAINGEFRILQETMNDWNIGLELYSFQKGQFEITETIPAVKFCDFIQKDENLMPIALASMNVPPKEQCPFPVGNYTMKNYVPDFSKIPPSIKGRMMAKSIFSKEGKVVDFVEYYFEVLHFV